MGYILIVVDIDGLAHLAQVEGITAMFEFEPLAQAFRDIILKHGEVFAVVVLGVPLPTVAE